MGQLEPDLDRNNLRENELDMSQPIFRFNFENLQ